ncbi:hypothetical protein LUZ60_002331 [Juncus effusus]|nr:hypothetical protein LUZ60_002313 [Juncus effusus]KAJ3678512.1 hypothetical protein LUZ60_002315 [Juncus effusus]KAJ3678514.1 hypothetical protein LUZ60_002317 [Juncus effusus]KAJ3678516.1 hypothetical protein LUZ60_002319 [Juncus effusus]KAJ3678518.1 hypothetical protein LUZ60_002321 [Juncus effusus]
MKSNDRCEISRLSNDILSHVISLTSPKDASRFQVISPAFKSASNSDAVWERFIPSDIISRFVDPLPVFYSKKELFFHLSDHDALIDDGTMTFRLDRKTGAKIYMVRAKNIAIAWADTQYWQRVPSHDSRFGEVATLLLVWWLRISHTFNIKELSPETMYASYLVFKLEDDSDGLDDPQQTFVTVGNYQARHNVCLQPEDDEMLPETIGNIRFPKERQNGWMEMELGKFYVDKGESGEVSTGLEEISKLYSKRGLIVEGIEIRPKEIDH